ncbi:hypothetical protein C8F01DRAFT_1017359, partial [Mycena amicta]
MSKSTSTHTLQLVTFSTDLSIKEVLSRLDAEIAKGAAPRWTGAGPVTRKQFEAQVESTLGPSGFRFFNEFDHGEWFQLYAPTREAHLYVIGNPLIARTILAHDMRAGINVPVRLLVIAKPDDKGTEVVYHLPSSTIALTEHEKLKAAAKYLDEKLERLVQRITSNSSRL